MSAPLSAAWIDHSPDIRRGVMQCGKLPPRVPSVEIRSEATCPCGTLERHTHCQQCGRLVSKGDWDAKPIREFTLRLR